MTVEQLQKFLDDTLVLDLFKSDFHSGHGIGNGLVALTDYLHRQLD